MSACQIHITNDFPLFIKKIRYQENRYRQNKIEKFQKFKTVSSRFE